MKRLKTKIICIFIGIVMLLIVFVSMANLQTTYGLLKNEQIEVVVCKQLLSSIPNPNGKIKIGLMIKNVSDNVIDLSVNANPILKESELMVKQKSWQQPFSNALNANELSYGIYEFKLPNGINAGNKFNVIFDINVDGKLAGQESIDIIVDYAPDTNGIYVVNGTTEEDMKNRIELALQQVVQDSEPNEEVADIYVDDFQINVDCVDDLCQLAETKLVIAVVGQDRGKQFSIHVVNKKGKKAVYDSWIDLTNGKSVTLNNLLAGTYIITEVVPMEYKCENNSISVTLTSGETREITIVNEYQYKGYFHSTSRIQLVEYNEK